ncbi:matrixin family metalloprotease [Yoonia sp. SS1-5]|uniref:Matrixin family metalloprotease n=1 Tax=Yoonia rhodophyticola TaxID=3137370 RepID=A0AAN0NLB6_9RHOB
MTYELLSVPFDGRDLNIKWGEDALGRESGEITWSMALGGLRYDTTLFTDADFEAAVAAAFDAWAAVADLSFQFIPGIAGDPDNDADIDVMTATEQQVPYLAGNTVGLASYSYSNGANRSNTVGEIVAADVYMDLQPNWSPFGTAGLNFYAVVLHEIGHALGLDHVDDTSEIMNDFVSTSDLGDGDIAGIRVLYGAAEGEDTGGGDGGGDGPGGGGTIGGGPPGDGGSSQTGTDGRDTIDLTGGGSLDPIYALAGADTVIGSADADVVYGGAGNDTVSGAGGADVIVDTLGTNTLQGGEDNDLIVGGIGRTIGSGDAGDDILLGGIGNDQLDGGAGQDSLRGDPSGAFFYGRDTLIAGTGDDFLEGGGGADTFVFVTAGGVNTIATLDIQADNPAATTAIGADFESGIDLIDLTDFGYGSGADVFDHIDDIGGHAVFADQGTEIHFIGLVAADLTSGDFLL